MQTFQHKDLEDTQELSLLALKTFNVLKEVIWKSIDRKTMDLEDTSKQNVDLDHLAYILTSIQC